MVSRREQIRNCFGPGKLSHQLFFVKKYVNFVITFACKTWYAWSNTSDRIGYLKSDNRVHVPVHNIWKMTMTLKISNYICKKCAKNVQKLRSTNFKLISPWHIQTQKPVSETLQQFLIFNLCVCHFSTYLSSFRISTDKKQIYYILKDFWEIQL